MIKFYYNNIALDSNLSATTENAQFKASNIKDDRRTKVYRSTSNSDTLTLDFGDTQEIDSFFIVDNPQVGFGINSLIIEASQSLSFDPLVLQETVSLNNKYGQGLVEFDAVNARYFRLRMESSLDYCEISNFFIGKKLEPKGINFGWTHKEDELINKSFNRYGQQFSDLIDTFKEFDIAFSQLTKDQLAEIDAMTDTVGTFKPLFVNIGCPDIQNELERFRGMVYINRKPTKTNTFFNRYSLSMTLREAK